MTITRALVAGADSLIQALFLTVYLAWFGSTYYTKCSLLFYSVGLIFFVLFSLFFNQITRGVTDYLYAIVYGAVKSVLSVVLFVITFMGRSFFIPQLLPVRDIGYGDGMLIIMIVGIYSLGTVCVRLVILLGNVAQANDY